MPFPSQMVPPAWIPWPSGCQRPQALWSGLFRQPPPLQYTYTPSLHSKERFLAPIKLRYSVFWGWQLRLGIPRTVLTAHLHPQLLPLPPNLPWPWPTPARDTGHDCLLSYEYVCFPNLFVTPWRIGTVSCSLSPQNLAQAKCWVRCESRTIKKAWTPKNWCFSIVGLEKTLEVLFDGKEIKPVHPKGNQPWIFIGRTDVKNRLVEKEPWTSRCSSWF